MKLTEPGPLTQPVRSYSIRRDEKRALVLETVAAGALRQVREDQALGTIRTLTEVVKFEGPGGTHATAMGVYPGDHTERTNAEGVRERTEICHVSALEIAVQSGNPHYVIDWLENVNRGPFIWLGEMIRDRSKPSDTRTIGEGETAISLKGGRRHDSSHHAALEVSIGGVTLFICEASDVDGRVSPGFVIYRGNPNEDTRRRIRNVVSFAMGVGFVYLGSSVFNADSELLSTSAKSGNPFGDRIFDFSADPPAPLGAGDSTIAKQANLSRVAAALYDHYDEMNFDALSWAYWHAVCAPIHMKPAHLGAAIEGLQDAYCEAHPDKARNRVIQDKAKAKALRDGLNAALVELELGDDLEAIFERKISNLNKVSGAVLSARILAELGLAVGDAEKAAWDRRNEAAHGTRRRPEDTIPVMRDSQLLRLLLNRMVLKIANASPTYLDNYTPGHAVRALSQSVPIAES